MRNYHEEARHDREAEDLEQWETRKPTRTNDPRPKDYNPQQILKLARDLKERLNGFMQACWRNDETQKLADYNKANEFGVSLDKTIESLQILTNGKI
jgi:hypothetical protein